MPYYKGIYCTDEEEYQACVSRDRRLRAQWCVEDLLRIGGLLPVIVKAAAAPAKPINKPSIQCETCFEYYTPGNPIRFDECEDGKGGRRQCWIVRCPHCRQENEL